MCDNYQIIYNNTKKKLKSYIDKFKVIHNNNLD